MNKRKLILLIVFAILCSFVVSILFSKLEKHTEIKRDNYLKQEKLEFYGENKYLENRQEFDELIARMYNQEWVSYCKPPFKNAKCVIRYLGRYTHRVAI